MNAFRCDCCKKFFVSHKGARNTMTLSNYDTDFVYDLCKDCCVKIKSMVTNKVEEEK